MTPKKTFPSPMTQSSIGEEQSAEKAADKVKQRCSVTESWAVYFGAMLTLKVNYNSNLSTVLFHIPLCLPHLPPSLTPFQLADFEATQEQQELNLIRQESPPLLNNFL